MFVNASKILTLNRRYQNVFQKRLLVLNKARNLIKTHRTEEGFTFIIDKNSITPMPFLEKEPPVPGEQPYAYTQMIYPMFFQKENPRYIISLTPEQIQQANLSSLEARVENFIEPPVLRWGQSDLDSFLLLVNAYIETGEKDKALSLVNKILKFHTNDHQLVEFALTIKEKIIKPRN